MNNLASGSKVTKRAAKRKVELRVPKLKKSTIMCQCGAQILLMPDFKEMNFSLEAHVNKHKKNDKISDVEAEAILDDLIAQVFEKIIQEDWFSPIEAALTREFVTVRFYLTSLNSEIFS